MIAAALTMPIARASAQALTPQPTTTPVATLPHASPPAATASPNAHARHKKAVPVAEVPPTPAPPPPTLEQLPPTPPQVSFQNGKLTIDATNSTLAQVLRAVQSRTGASIDIPAGAGSDRVVAQLGPGQPRDVLNALLNGSKFDYVILGVTGGDPGAVQKVILTPRQGGATITAQSNNPRQSTPDDESPADEGVPVADTAENEYQAPEQPPPPSSGFHRPMMPGGGQIEPGSAFVNGEVQNGQRIPDQQMQQLQQMQQQQQLNPVNQNPQPQ